MIIVIVTLLKRNWAGCHLAKVGSSIPQASLTKVLSMGGEEMKDLEEIATPADVPCCDLPVGVAAVAEHCLPNDRHFASKEGSWLLFW